ncbi:MAG TPA: glucose-6-phosphate dehydrogenase, partial [Bacteroidia bacterium]|nr:glucose-6-phosphate dehydrogenase [Bacteroidia bacterium]
MEPKAKTPATILIILGAAGDLAWRKLVPAIYNLYLDKWQPEHFAVIGVGRKKMSANNFHKHLHEGVDKFSRRGKSKKSEWDGFAKYLNYLKGEFNAISTYSEI